MEWLKVGKRIRPKCAEQLDCQRRGERNLDGGRDQIDWRPSLEHGVEYGFDADADCSEQKCDCQCDERGADDYAAELLYTGTRRGFAHRTGVHDYQIGYLVECGDSAHGEFSADQLCGNVGTVAFDHVGWKTHAGVRARPQLVCLLTMPELGQFEGRDGFKLLLETAEPTHIFESAEEVPAAGRHYQQRVVAMDQAARLWSRCLHR